MSKKSVSEGVMTGTAGLLEVGCFLTPTGNHLLSYRCLRGTCMQRNLGLRIALGIFQFTVER